MRSVANEQNLIPFTSNQSREEAKKNGAKGGQKSGEVRRQRKAMKEQFEMLLTLPFTQTKQLKFIESLGIKTEDIDNQMALVVSIYGKALKGDVQAFNIIREVVQDNQVINKENRVQIINDLPEDDEDGTD